MKHIFQRSFSCQSPELNSAYMCLCLNIIDALLGWRLICVKSELSHLCGGSHVADGILLECVYGNPPCYRSFSPTSCKLSSFWWPFCLSEFGHQELSIIIMFLFPSTFLFYACKSFQWNPSCLIRVMCSTKAVTWNCI